MGTVVAAQPAGTVLVPGGEFQMGRHSGTGDSGQIPVHDVDADSFVMDDDDVTDQQSAGVNTPRCADRGHLRPESFQDDAGSRLVLSACTSVEDCDDFDVCTYDECVDSACSNASRRYADVDGNGYSKLFDIFCVMSLIAGDPVGPECNAVNADIAGLRGECDPNGALNVFDIFAILDMIAGVDPCCSPQLTGACCTAGVCTDGVTHANCYYDDGYFMGDGTDCGSVTCP